MALTISPETLSLIKTPRTHVRLQAQTTAPSGGWARVLVRERHQLRNGSVELPEFVLDVQLFRNPFRVNEPVIGTIPVHMRQTIDRALTLRAEMLLSGRPSPPPFGYYQFAPTHRLDDLSLEIGNLDPSPPVQFTRDDPTDLPLVRGSERLTAFQLRIGGQASVTPSLSFEHPSRMAMFLLRRIDQGRWAFVDTLAFDGSGWHTQPGSSALAIDGWYALVALDFPVATVAGRVLNNAQPRPGAILQTASHPWLALSDNAGRFTLPLPQSDQAQTLTASYAFGNLTAAATLNSVDASGYQDLALDLAPVQLRLVSRLPAAGQFAVPTWQSVDLFFSEDLEWDQPRLAEQLTLTGPDGAVPIRLFYRAREGGVRLQAETGLAPATTYTVTAAAGIEAVSGAVTTETYQFSFTTHQTNQETPLAMNRCYLSADEQDRLFLNIPDGVCPARSNLIVLNLDNASSFSEQLPGGAVQRPLDGAVGDRFRIEITSPKGNYGQILLDSVRRGTDRFVLGGLPMRIEINAATVLEIDQIRTGIGRELIIQPVTESEVTTLRGELPEVLRNNFPLLGGISLRTADDRPMPQFTGSLRFDTATVQPQLEASPDGMIGLVQYVQGVIAPADPRQPDELCNHTVVRLADAKAVPKDIGAAKSSLTSELLFQFESTDTRYGAYVFELHQANTYRVRVETARENPIPVAGLDLLSDDQLFWADANPRQHLGFLNLGGKTYRHIKSAPVFHVRKAAFQSVFNFIGLTDQYGFLDVVTPTDSGRPQPYASDPLSHAIGPASSFGDGIQIFGYQLISSMARLNWPDENSDEPNALEKVSTTYEVVDITRQEENEEIEVNTEETQRLEKLGRFHLAPDRALRVILRTRNTPFLNAQFGGDFLDEVSVSPEATGLTVTYIYRNFPDDRAYVDLYHAYALTLNARQSRERRIWLVSDG